MRAPGGGSFKVTKGAAHAVLGLIQVDPEVTAASVNRKARPLAGTPHLVPRPKRHFPCSPSRRCVPCVADRLAPALTRVLFHQRPCGGGHPLSGVRPRPACGGCTGFA